MEITSAFIKEQEVADILIKSMNPDKQQVREILSKGLEMKGLKLDDVAVLTGIREQDQLEELFRAANTIKETIYGKRLVLFAPLYISNLCANECVYCAFRAKNTEIERKALSQEEIMAETETLIGQGHKRILLVAGEYYTGQGIRYVLDSVRSVYSARHQGAGIRRINVNVAPLEVDEFRMLKEEKIGTYQLFQETYHRETYRKVHTGGRKRDYDWRVTAMHRAMEAGIDDVGIGALFGLYDYRFELLAMLQHIAELEKVYGVGPHTISVPRMEPATGSEMASHPPYAVSDLEFKKIVAILRLAVPYTGIIMSTRESPQMRNETFRLGVSQISAGSRTNPGGYEKDNEASGQFYMGDHRPLDQVIFDVVNMGYIPSFCTGCYRLGRTGQDFMDLAKPGEIKNHCSPNALSSFMEYLNDYASPKTFLAGTELIERTIASMTGLAAERARKLVDRVKAGQKDVFC